MATTKLPIRPRSCSFPLWSKATAFVAQPCPALGYQCRQFTDSSGMVQATRASPNSRSIGASIAELVNQLPVGKRVNGDIYIHRAALAMHHPTLLNLVSGYAHDREGGFSWNVCKLSPRRRRVSLLFYPCFRELAHPALSAVLTVDLSRGTARVRRYYARSNRPILHRKELLLDVTDPDYQRFAALTEEEERAGLFMTPSIIGHERGWAEQLERLELSIQDHILCRRLDGSRQS